MARTKATGPYWVKPGPLKKCNGQRRPSGSEEQRRYHLRKKHTPKASQPQDINPQSSCPLYSLPLELRDSIFQLALTTYEDKGQPFALPPGPSTLSKYSTGYPKHRPGHFCTRRTDIALLLTCRLIYSETRLIPVAINTHTLCYRQSPALSNPVPTLSSSYFSRMSPEHLAAVQHVHIFASRHTLRARNPDSYCSSSAWAELGLLRCGGGKGYRVRRKGYWRTTRGPFMKTFKITIPWDMWARTSAYGEVGLGFLLTNECWENVLGGVRMLTIELENGGWDKEYWKAVVESLLSFEFEIGDEEVLVPQREVEERTWMGSINRGGDGEPRWEDKKVYVVTMVWKVRQRGELGEPCPGE